MKLLKKVVMKKIHSFLLFLIILVISLGVRFYWESQKTAFHVDEVMSFVLCDYGDLGWKTTFQGVYTGAEAKRAMLFPHPGLDDAISDIKHNWKDNRDHYHTNFYYSILRLWLVGFQSYNIHDIIVHCLWLNYIFYVAYFVLLYFFLQLFFRERPKILFLGLLLIGVSASDIANTIFIREYMLQELGALFLAYIVVKTVNHIELDSYRYSVRNFMLTVFAVWAIIFNGYFQFVYVGFLGLYLVCLLCQKREYGRLVFFAGAMIVAVILCYACYHGFFKIFTESNKVSGGVLSRGIRGMVMPLYHYVKLVTHYTLYLPYIFVVGYVVFKKKQCYRQIPWVFLVALLYSIAAIWVTPIISNRYIVSVTPLLLLIVPWSIAKLNGNEHKIAVLICVFTSFIMVCFKGNIENLNFDEVEKNNPLNNGIKYPTYIVQNKEQCWTLCDIVPYLEDNRNYIFVHSLSEIKEKSAHVVAVDVYRMDLPVDSLKKRWHFVGTGSFYNYYFVK